jgi:hypothetical protein
MASETRREFLGWGRMGRNKQQESREFGIKFAKALRVSAREAADAHDLDDRYIVLGAAEYLRKDAEFRLDLPLNPARTRDDEREN